VSCPSRDVIIGLVVGMKEAAIHEEVVWHGLISRCATDIHILS
jgi:hypothetical protein